MAGADTHSRAIDRILVIALLGQMGLTGATGYLGTSGIEVLNRRITALEARLQVCTDMPRNQRSSTTWNAEHSPPSLAPPPAPASSPSR